MAVALSCSKDNTDDQLIPATQQSDKDTTNIISNLIVSDGIFEGEWRYSCRLPLSEVGHRDRPEEGNVS